jgi:phage baseplate assembly protein W
MIAGPQKKYDFKSVGLKNDSLDLENRNQFQTKNPIGIKSPLSFGDSTDDGLFSMHRNLLDQIKDNLKIILRTNHGERIPHYDFGANLLPLAFEISTDPGDMEAMRRISKTLKKYLPQIIPSSFEPLVSYSENSIAKIGIRMGYDIPILGVKNQFVDVVIYAVG